MYNLLLSNNHVVVVNNNNNEATCLNFPIALLYVVLQFVVYCVFWYLFVFGGLAMSFVF